MKKYYSVDAFLDDDSLWRKARKEFVVPEEFQQFLVENENIYAGFQKFTKGKQKEFVDYINNAKQIATKVKRLERIRPLILRGEGLNDRYK